MAATCEPTEPYAATGAATAVAAPTVALIVLGLLFYCMRRAATVPPTVQARFLRVSQDNGRLAVLSVEAYDPADRPIRSARLRCVPAAPRAQAVAGGATNNGVPLSPVVWRAAVMGDGSGVATGSTVGRFAVEADYGKDRSIGRVRTRVWAATPDLRMELYDAQRRLVWSHRVTQPTERIDLRTRPALG